jgi:ATP synthase E chain
MYHQAKLSSAAKLAAINREYEHKQQLIAKAKAEYSKSKLPASAKSESGESTFVPELVISHVPSFGIPAVICNIGYSGEKTGSFALDSLQNMLTVSE